LNTTLHNVTHPFTPYCTLHTPHSATHNAQYILHTTYLTLHESTLHSVKYHKPLTPHSTVLHTTNSTLLKSSASLHAGKTYQGFANCFFESAICKFLFFWTTPLIRYTGCLKKNCAVGVLVTEETIFVQFSQSRCLWNALFFSYFKVYIFSFNVSSLSFWGTTNMLSKILPFCV